MEKNFPMIYIYGDSSKGNTSGDAKVRIAFGRERKEMDRSQETDWVCKMVLFSNLRNISTCLTWSSAILTISLPESDAFDARV